MHGPFDQLGSHCCRVLHRGGRVDFDQPNLKVLVNHEIVSQDLKAVFAVLHILEHTLQRLVDDLLHLGLYLRVVDFFAEHLLKLSLKLPLVHHITLDSIVLVVDAFGH